MAAETFATMNKTAILKSFPKFAGKSNENFTDFCSSFATKLRTLGIDYVDAIDLFPACLDGYAAERPLECYLTQEIPKIEPGTQGKEPKDVWNDLLKLMAQALAKPYQNEVAQEQLNARRPRDNEDLETYMKDIQQLVSLAYSAARQYSDARRKAEVVKYFVRGLNMPLKEHVINLQTTDPETLLQKTHLEEEMQRQLRRERLSETISINMIRDMSTANNYRMEEQQRNQDNRTR